MPKLTNLVPAGTLIWHNNGTSMLAAEYRGKTVDMLHEIEVLNIVDDRPGRVIAVPRSQILLSK